MLSSYDLSKIVSSGTDEVEIRFLEIGGALGYNSYIRLRDEFSKRATPILEKTIDQYGEGVRKTTFENGDVLFITKDNVYKNDNQDYAYRLSISREIEVSEVRTFNPTLTREKNRMSYYIFEGDLRLDLTTVTSKSRVRGDLIVKTTYEAELEVLNKTTPKGRIEAAMTAIIKIIQDTNILYTLKDKKKMISWTNSTLGGYTSDSILDTSKLARARNIKVEDMVIGGLVGGKTTYAMCHKVDGIGRLLCISPLGVFFISGPSSVTLITRDSPKLLVGTILEGEVVQDRMKNSPTSKYWFIPYDALSMPILGGRVGGTISIQSSQLNKRLEYCRAVSEVVNIVTIGDRVVENELLTITTKNYRTFNNAEEFFSCYRQFSDQEGILGYKQDGMIITPASIPYSTAPNKIPLSKRILTRIPDICKIKPVDLMTIDLSYHSGVLHMNDGKNRRTIPFEAPGFTSPHPSPLLEGLPDGTVVEFSRRRQVECNKSKIRQALSQSDRCCSRCLV